MIHIIFKAIRIFDTPEGKQAMEEVCTKNAVQAPESKMSSPGVRQSAHAQLDEFLNTCMDRTACIDLQDIVSSNPLIPEELRALAKLVEKGERTVNPTIYRSPEKDVIVIEVKHG